MQSEVWQNKGLADALNKGDLAVMPTDTVYGIVARAEDPAAVARVYEARRRNPDKPCIILIAGPEEAEKFSIKVSEIQKEKLSGFWPGPVSVILDCPADEFTYLHRGTKTLAFRVPAAEGLRQLLRKTGPLIAPSANTEGNPISLNIEEARRYFGSLVGWYADGGDISGKASRVVRLYPDGSVDIIRE